MSLNHRKAGTGGVISRRPAAGSPLAAYGAALGSLAPRLAAAEQDRHLARQLLAMSPLIRVEVAAFDQRFRRLSLAKMLVLQAEAALFEPAGDPRPWAELAVAIGAAVGRDLDAGARRTTALGSWLLGKGLLRSWHRRLARDAFHSMGAALREGEISEELALMCAGLAQVHEDLGLVDGATACWLKSGYLYSQLGAKQPGAACLAQLGLLLLESGDAANAVVALDSALRVIDVAFAPSLTAQLRLAMAEAEMELCHAGAARERRRGRRIRRTDPQVWACSTSSRMLGDRLLRSRGEHEDPIGAATEEV